MQSEIRTFSGKFAFLSNFYSANSWYDRCIYPTAEHAYQAAKCANVAERRQFQMHGLSAGKAKRRGRSVELRSDWDQLRITIMKEILLSKFRNPVLVTLLKDTGSAMLIEGNTWRDCFWGVCNGRGENWLGRLLMQVRESLGGPKVEWKQELLGEWSDERP